MKERKKYYLSCRGDKFQALQTKGRKNDIWKKSEIENKKKKQRIKKKLHEKNRSSDRFKREMKINLIFQKKGTNKRLFSRF